MPPTPPPLTDLPLELDAVAIQLQADQRLPDDLAMPLSQASIEILADWLAEHVPDLVARLSDAQVQVIEDATARITAHNDAHSDTDLADRLSPLDELPTDLQLPFVVISPGAAYEAAVVRLRARTRVG
jgi:hypothetical protein